MFYRQHAQLVQLCLQELFKVQKFCMEVKHGVCKKDGNFAKVRTMCGLQLNDRKRTKDLIPMLGLIETISHFAMANSVCWYDHVLRKEDGHVLRRALDFEVEGQRKRGRLKRT